MAIVQITSDSRYPLDRGRVRSVIDRVLEEHKSSSTLIVSVAVVGDRKMRVLNREYHDVDATTDVLSFPYLDPSSKTDTEQFVVPEGEDRILGDLAISYPQVVKQAREKGILVDDEVDFLIEHGMLHLLGIHHD